MVASPNMSTAGWYYAKDSQRLGPVTDLDLEALVRQGVVGPGTLVWRAGMGEWQPWERISAMRGDTWNSPGSADSTHACIECGRNFAPDDLVELMGAPVCGGCKPVRLQRIREGLAVEGAHEAFADDRDVVVLKDGVLPSRCVCCNAPATTRMRREFHWYPPWVTVLVIFPGILIALIVMLALRKRMRMEVPLCDEHRRRRSQRILSCVVWGVGSLLLLGVSIPTTTGTTMWVLIVGFILSALAALTVGSQMASMLIPRRITQEAGRFKGASPDFLASLPRWPGRLKV